MFGLGHRKLHDNTTCCASRGYCHQGLCGDGVGGCPKLFYEDFGRVGFPPTRLKNGTRGRGMCGLRMRQFGVRMGKKRYAPDEVMRAVSLVAAGGMSLRGAERATGVSRETIRRVYRKLSAHPWISCHFGTEGHPVFRKDYLRRTTAKWPSGPPSAGTLAKRSARVNCAPAGVSRNARTRASSSESSTLQVAYTSVPPART